MSSAKVEWVARMHPMDKGRGHVMGTYTMPNPRDKMKTLKFRHDHDGWYKVAPDVAEHLKGVHSRPGNPSSPLAFVVRTKAEVIAEARAEKARRESEEGRANIVDMGAAEAEPVAAPAPASEPEPAPRPTRVSRSYRTRRSPKQA